MVRYERRELAQMETPLYFSLFASPGFDFDTLQSFGLERGIGDLFMGRIVNQDQQDEATIFWGTETHHIESKTVKFNESLDLPDRSLQ